MWVWNISERRFNFFMMQRSVRVSTVTLETDEEENVFFSVGGFC